jgi:hypothetical protein
LAVPGKEGGKEGGREGGDKQEMTGEGVTAELKGRPYPSDYPGLRLGCVKEGGKMGQYCAAKRGALEGGQEGGVVCDFFLSCCYAQYVRMQWGGLPPVEEVEGKCPGSKAFLYGKLCTA